ncbi:hypothetical protein OIV83_005851 [Microbotryomycetes sp. JL201]|nr:hypothetical protein OIV83_005851 [Microbotryomycetes sp. JL201]
MFRTQLTLGIIKPTVAATPGPVQGTMARDTGQDRRRSSPMPDHKHDLADAVQPSSFTDIMRHIKASGLEIARSKKLFWKESDAEQFYAEHRGEITSLLQVPISDTLTSSLQAVSIFPGSFKLQHQDNLSLLRYMAKVQSKDGSDSPDSARKELAQIFEGWDVDWWLAQQKANQ